MEKFKDAIVENVFKTQEDEASDLSKNLEDVISVKVGASNENEDIVLSKVLIVSQMACCSTIQSKVIGLELKDSKELTPL